MLISPLLAGLALPSLPHVQLTDVVAALLAESKLAETTLTVDCSPEGSGTSCRDIRLNSFTESSQDNVSVSAAPDGSLVAVWHSRRQEGGTYGVRARRIGADGLPLSEEVEVNETTAGMQVEPSMSLDPSGAAWFAWVSRGQDGHGDGVYARRFSSQLDAATHELRVDDATLGDQSEPSIVALEGGRALCVWTGPADADVAGERPGSRAAFARFLGANGQPDGPRFTLDFGSHLGVRTPTTARLASGALVAVASYDDEGRPAGIYVLAIDARGAMSARVRVDGSHEGGLPVEPSLSTTEGRAAIAWLEARQGEKSGEYGIYWRNLSTTETASWFGERNGTKHSAAPELGSIRTVEAPEAGYTSGLVVAATGTETALVWSRHLASENGAPRLYCEVSRESSLNSGSDPITVLDPRRATAAEEGKQAMAVGGAGQRAQILGDGRIVVAWHGDAHLGDSSGAHLSLISLERQDATARVLADVRPTSASSVPTPVPTDHPEAFLPLRSGSVAQLAGAAESGAPAPHDPPTFDPKNVDHSNPQGDVRRNSVAGVEIDFEAFTSTGWTPPDPEMAVGMNHIVAIVNGGIRFFDKQGTLLFVDQIEDAAGFWGNEGATSFVFDPEVVWDPHTDRFVAIAAERSGNSSFYLLAISDDGDPTGNWFKYRLDVTPIIGNNIDSVNLSVDSQGIYLTADFFNPTRYFIYIVDKASVLNGGTPVTTHTTIVGNHSMGAPVNYDAGADSAYFVFAPETPTSSAIQIYSVDDPLGTPTVQSTTVAVPTYGQPADPPQMGSTSRPNLFEARFWSAVLRNGKLWATHHQGSPARQRWYEIDMAGWPQSGQLPTLVQSGDVDAGPGISTYFGSLWVDAAGAMAMTFAMSSSSSFISMARTGRSPGDPAGATNPPQMIISSTSPETSGRWGDYSATNNDPANSSRFWGHHEYRTSGWRTRIASFSNCTSGFENYCPTSPNSVGSGATLLATGSALISENSLSLNTQGAAPGVFGVFFYGDARATVPGGDGVRCVGGNIFRLGVTQSNFFGGSFFNVDLTMPQTPAATVTAGSTWNFQYFYRDFVPMGSGFNYSDAVAVQFCD